MSSYIGKHRTPRTHARGITRAAGTTAMVVSIAGAVPAVASPGEVSPSRATMNDGCGRVDSLSIEGSDGPYKVWLPGLTMDDPDFVPPTTDPDAKPPQVPAYEVVEDKWVRKANKIEQSGKGSNKGLGIRITDKDDRYVPMTDGSGRFGTETFVFTNDDCATPLEPTFTDEDGAANDTVTIPSVKGVKYNGGKPGTNAAKGRVTITAAPEKGYRLVDENGEPLSASAATWSHTFSAGASVSVPDGKAPTFRRGAWVADNSGKSTGNKSSKNTKTPGATSPSGRVRTPNVVILHPVEGITWMVDGKPATGGKGSKKSGAGELIEFEVGTRESVTVEAVSADPKLWSVDGETTWELGAPSTATTVPVVTAPRGQAGVPLGRARVNWKVPFGVEGNFTYDVAYRSVNAGPRGRSVTPWQKWTYDTALTSGTLAGQPGGVYEVTARSVDAAGTASEWSRPTLVLTPLDIRTGPRGSWSVNNRAAGKTGNTLVSSTKRGAAWTTRSTYTDTITLWFGTGLQGGRAKIYVDGKHVAWAGTFDRKPNGGRTTVTIPVTWGRHTVKVVNDSIGRRTTVALDGIAYGR